MTVSGEVVLSEYPERLSELAVQVQVNTVESRFAVRKSAVEVLSQMDLTGGELVSTGIGLTMTQYTVSGPSQSPACG